jgi:hypothetical protein
LAGEFVQGRLTVTMLSTCVLAETFEQTGAGDLVTVIVTVAKLEQPPALHALYVNESDPL